jgi:hypothetical protein
MNFITPIWLLSIAAISIPLLIHLWNITPGKTLKVGSITLIEQSSRKRSRSFKLLDILLLLLRCLFIILLAIVLGLPYFKSHENEKKEKGWLLVPKVDFKEAYQKFKPKADSLIKAGYELHYFEPGFKKVSIDEALADTIKPAITAAKHWSLLRQLEQQAGSSVPIYLITPDLLNKFSGNRPVTDLKLTWQTYTPADSTTVSIKKAWFTPDKNVRVLVTKSTPGKTLQYSEIVNPTSSKNSPYDIEFKDGKATISLENDEKNKVKIDTPALSVDVFSVPETSDAGYVKAALQSLSQFTQQNIIVKDYNENSTVKHDWLFWLSDKPLAANVLSRYKNVLTYKNGKTASSKTWVNFADDNTLTSGRQVIPIFKSVAINSDNTETLWQDGFGNQVLTAGGKDQTRIYNFYGRFNAGWNDLVWDASFPQVIQRLIYPEEQSVYPENDKRRIDQSQIKPVTVENEAERAVNYEQRTDLTHYFWLLLVLIFVVESWLAHKKAGTVTA